MNKISRRDFITMTSAAAAFVCAPKQVLSFKPTKNQNEMYGLIGKIIATPGQRDRLIDILLEGTADMPGCLSYIVSKDSEDANVIWVTEVWDSKQSHQASLKLLAVQEAIAQGRPFIAEFETQIETEPAGGHGLVSKESR